MFSIGRVISTLVATIYFCVFCVVAAFGHTKTIKQGDEIHGPCAQALESLGDDFAGHAAVARIKEKVVQENNVYGHMENLAWTYIDAARNTHDDRFFVQAEHAANCITAKQPRSPAARLILGHVRHQQHRFKEAEVFARELVTDRGYWFDHALLGDVLTEQGKLDEAVSAYDAMVSQKPGPQAYSRIAYIRWLTGDSVGAIDAMRLAITAAGGSDEHRAWSHVRLAKFLFHDGQLRAAEQAVDTALLIKPQYPAALALRGRIFLANDRPSEAVPLLAGALKRSPLPMTQWWLIEALQEVGSDAEVAQVEQKMMRNVEEDPRAVALYLANNGSDRTKAIDLAKRELLNRRDALTLDAMAWALHAAGQDERALDFSREAMEQGLDHARLHLHGAVLERIAGDSARAADLLNKAIGSRTALLPSEQARLNQEIALASS